jgi:kynurenine formamidase
MEMTMEYIDLSYKLEHGMPVYPGDAEVSLVHAKTLDKDRHNAYRISTGLHAGTHIDFPMHLLPDDRTADTYPLDRFAGRGCLIDARGVKQIEYKAVYDHLVQKGDIVLLYTGACASFGQPGYYTDRPAVADDLAEFLVSREIKMFGADLPSPRLSAVPGTQTTPAERDIHHREHVEPRPAAGRGVL